MVLPLVKIFLVKENEEKTTTDQVLTSWSWTRFTGFLGLTFLYASEIAPLSMRVPITSISTGTAWAFNFLVAEITPIGFATLKYRYFIIWACINLLLITPCELLL